MCLSLIRLASLKAEPCAGYPHELRRDYCELCGCNHVLVDDRSSPTRTRTAAFADSQLRRGGDPPIRFLSVGQFFAPPPVAALLDELPRTVEVVARRAPLGRVVFWAVFHESEQPRAMKMDVGEMQSHRAALGDLMSLVEVLARPVEIAGRRAEQGASEEGAAKIIPLTSRAKKRQGGVDVSALRPLPAQDCEVKR